MKKARFLQGANRKEFQPVAIRVDRRKLLQLATFTVGVALSSGFLPLLSRATTVDQPVKMKGTSTGKILLSRDDGKTWEVATDLGDECSVRSIRSTSRGFYADIGHKGYRFTLHSVDGRHWKG